MKGRRDRGNGTAANFGRSSKTFRYSDHGTLLRVRSDSAPVSSVRGHKTFPIVATPGVARRNRQLRGRRAVAAGVPSLRSVVYWPPGDHGTRAWAAAFSPRRRVFPGVLPYQGVKRGDGRELGKVYVFRICKTEKLVFGCISRYTQDVFLKKMVKRGRGTGKVRLELK